jgi:transcriptional regulator with XRE-family HTH domain
MPNKIRTHLLDEIITAGPAHLMKEQFGKRLYRLMVQKGWSQSELGRQSGLPRDSISVYIRGKSLPTDKSLAALAEALGVPAEELLPNHVESAIESNNPMIDVKISPNAPGTALLRINALLPSDVALAIQKLVLDATNTKADVGS